MTLIELVMSVTVIAGLAAVLSAAVVVTLRQQEGTQERVDAARWEQSLALWLPADLSSAGVPPGSSQPAVDVDPGTVQSPCSISDCSFGVNALLLRWGPDSDRTTVSYRYGPDPSTGGFMLVRVECDGTCQSIVMLRDLAPPYPGWTDGDPIAATDLDGVIDVTVPLSADSSTDTDATSTAQRVIVTVNGLPTPSGVDRSARVSFTAGGTARDALDPPQFEGPDFLDAQSACGGPITLIVDESGSIGSADDAVEDAVRGFVDAFAGTPTQLQVIEFSSNLRIVGGTGGGNRYWDLTEPTQVTALKSALDVNSGGSTNWENALYRAFYDQTGTPHADAGNPAVPAPELVVFFTDGEPTRDRTNAKSDTASTNIGPIPSRYDHSDNNAAGALNPRAWYRADHVADLFRNIRIIGVGVGPTFSSTTRVAYPGWPTGASQDIPNEVFLGDLVSGGDPSLHGQAAGSGNFVKRVYAPGSGWGDVSNADLLVSNDLGRLASALSAIALSECGGTLTVQTREQPSNTTAGIDVTYRIDRPDPQPDEQSTTSAIRKAAAFNVGTASGAPTTVRLIPEINTPGWSAVGWSCTSAGVDLGSDYGQVSADPIDGIDVTVRSNGAVSCTMRVTGP